MDPWNLTITHPKLEEYFVYDDEPVEEYLEVFFDHPDLMGAFLGRKRLPVGHPSADALVRFVVFLLRCLMATRCSIFHIFPDLLLLSGSCEKSFPAITPMLTSCLRTRTPSGHSLRGTLAFQVSFDVLRVDYIYWQTIHITTLSSPSLSFGSKDSSPPTHTNFRYFRVIPI